jgi:hypothetical protein
MAATSNSKTPWGIKEEKKKQHMMSLPYLEEAVIAAYVAKN